jgi:hypothetical protein
MMDKVKDNLGVQMNFTNALDHVPEAERNNRTIKERVRAAYHQLPYKALPRQLFQYLVTTQASKLNLFKAKGGISPYYSLRTILGLPPLDYDKHCAVSFGAYSILMLRKQSMQSTYVQCLICRVATNYMI